jgi:hypothetical protein
MRRHETETGTERTLAEALGPPSAGRPSPEANRLLLHATRYNTSLRRILTVASSQFDLRVAVHPTWLYNQTPEVDHLETLIHYLQIRSERGVPRKENLSRTSFQEEDQFSSSLGLESSLELELEEREGRDLEGVPASRCCFYALYLWIQVLQGLASEISSVINFYLSVSLNVIIILLVCDSFWVLYSW